MALQEKLELLSKAAQYDLACACGPSTGRVKGPDDRWIYSAALSDGRTVPLLKVLQSSGCERNCGYCVERAGGVDKSASFTPDELAGLFSGLWRSKIVDGLFLSSAIRGTARATMDRMLATCELVRFKHRFFGFIHLKIIPGAEEAQILRAMELANRVSINLETPTQDSLKKIAPAKNFERQLVDTMKFIGKNLGREGMRCRSQTTQFVVGASDESDLQIADTLWKSYREMNLARGYFSAFQPVRKTPLEDRPATPTMREHRLYQVDFLFRKYGFSLEDLIFDATSNLSLATDPKTLFALHHPELFPVEINKAQRKTLLRVPGIGPLAADRIERARKQGKIRDVGALKKISRQWKTAAPYLLFDGRLQSKESAQLNLF